MMATSLIPIMKGTARADTPAKSVSVYYLWGTQLLACFDPETGWSRLGLTGIDNCPHRPKADPPPAKGRAFALTKGGTRLTLPKCAPPRPQPLGLTREQAIDHLRQAVKAKGGTSPKVDMARIGGASEPDQQRSYEVELDGDSLPDRLVTVTGWSVHDTMPNAVPRNRKNFWTAWLLFPGRAPQEPKVIHLTDAYQYGALALDYCSDLDGDGRQELVMMASDMVQVAGLEGSLGAPAREKAQQYDIVDWGYILVELEGDALVARGAVYVDQPDY